MKYHLLLSFLLLGSFSLHAQDIEFDDADLNELDDIEFENLVHTKQDDEGPFVVLSTLLTLLPQNTLLSLLEQQIYLRTNPPHDRSLLDLPALYYYEVSHPLCGACNRLSLGFIPFYNQTSTMHLTCTSKTADYINLNNTDLIDKIIEIAKTVGTNLNLAEVLPLFSAIQLQQRRIGGMFRLGFDIPRWGFQYEIPLYYLERNFFLSQCTIDALRSTDLIRNLSSGSTQKETQELMIEHFLADRLGFGDSRLSALYTAYQNESNCVFIGGQITFPTAFAFKRGLMGGKFCPDDSRIPSPNTESLIGLFEGNPTLSTALTKQAFAFLFAVLDRLTTITADTSLGNNGHFVFAPLFEWRVQPLDWLGFVTRGTVQFFTQNYEHRYFLRNVDLSGYIQDFSNDEEASFNFTVIDQALINALIPEAFKVHVKPAPLIELTEQVTFTHKWFQTALGYDFWWQGQEKLRAPSSRFTSNKFELGVTPAAYQQKLFGYLGVIFDYPDHRFDVALHWDATFASKGIGKDFSLALAFRWLF